ncbi:MAG: UDP-N-acetylmuramoyl-tripeptide--D-alanyl-D-alanine ligase [Kiritimatiellae bacterium]|nr:UDP-N-acetylmuramoyl-tripeptide--D-alanyl-D-alanine ligase [Kiritimatiellia bacterium]
MSVHPSLAAVLPARFTGASILVAAINETFSLRQTVETVERTCDPADLAEFLVLLHPTRTTPGCRAEAEALVGESAGKTPVRIVFQTLPFAGGAYRSGFQEARGSHAVMISADLETPPELVARMIAVAKEKPGCVVTASRWMKGGSFSGYNKVKQVCNAVFEKLMSALFLTRLDDLTFGYRLFPAALLRAVDWKELRHPFFLETSVAPLRLGMPFEQIPANWKPRPEGESQNSFFANFRYFKTALRVRFARRASLLRAAPAAAPDAPGARFTLREARAWTGAAAEGPLPPSFPGVYTDTREAPEGRLFAALRGETFDGHAFAADAVAAGAAGVLAAADADLPPGLPALRVPDTAAALRALAAGYRAKVSPFVLGVTGSAGKTTTKEIAAHLLGALGPAFRTPGNWNNDLGLPKSILAMPPDTRFAVLEAGTNHPGEIAPLAALMRPDAAIVTNVGPVHLGHFGTEAAIAREKGALPRAVPASGFVVLDAALPHFAELRDGVAARVVTVSSDPAAAPDADYVAENPGLADGSFDLRDRSDGSVRRLATGLPGRHQIADALLAVAAARRLGVSWDDLAARLRTVPRVAHRWAESDRGGAHWIDDAYNANPAAAESALEAFACVRPGARHVAVLGDMGELGGGAEALHRRVGRAAAARGADVLVAVGPLSRALADEAVRAGMSASDVHLAPDATAARDLLARLVQPGDCVLLKASRAVGLERALPPL